MRITRPIADSEPITLTWTTTTVEEHRHTFTYAQLRDAVNTARTHLALPTRPGIGDDLNLLDETWLGDFETQGDLEEFTREITDAPDFTSGDLPVFTVTVEGPERHDGEQPYTYLLPADDLDSARRLAVRWHIVSNELDEGADGQPGAAADVRVLEGPWNTFRGAPAWPAYLPGRAWTDLRAEPAFLALAYASTPTDR